MKPYQWHSGQTQVYWTCKALLDGRTITHQTEIREVRGWRLGAIVHRLRHEYGWPITVEYRARAKVAHYSLAKDCDLARLQFPPSASALGQGEAAQ